MISNGNYERKEIATRENTEGEYSPITDNLDRIFMDLLNYAAENPDAEGDWEEYQKGVYQDNYYFESEGIDYLVQHDIVTGTLTLYELRPLSKYEPEEEPYCPSATAGDYSPSNPWDAPGMSISDFI